VSQSDPRTSIAKATAWLIGGVAWTIFYLARLVPARLVSWVAVPLGRAIRPLMGLGIKTSLLDRVEQVLGPFAGPDAEDAFWQKRLRHLGLTVFEPFHLFWSSDEELEACVELVGEEHLKSARDGGNGAILFLNHLGNPGTLVTTLGGLRGYDTAFAGNQIVACIAGRDVPLEGVESLVTRMFSRAKVERVLLGPGLPGRMAGVLARNGLFGMFMDFPVVEKHNRLMPFGHARMTLNLGPALLALRHRVPVFAVTTVRTGLNQHRLTVTPLALPEKGVGLEERAADLIEAGTTRMLEALREYPDQWWPWEHAPLAPSPDHP